MLKNKIKSKKLFNKILIILDMFNHTLLKKEVIKELEPLFFC